MPTRSTFVFPPALENLFHFFTISQDKGFISNVFPRLSPIHGDVFAAKFSDAEVNTVF